MRFLICGVLFCFLLFAVTGAGVMLPDARTRVGETPGVGRPMMQRSMADGPAQAQLYMMTVARRADELERLREQAANGMAPASGDPEAAPPETEPGPDLPKTAVAVNPASGATAPDALMAEDAEAPVRIAPTEVVRNDRPEEAPEPRVAALEPPFAEGGQSIAEGGEPVPRLVNVPLPPPRPAFFGAHRRMHLLHRRHRVVVVQRDVPSVPAQSAPVQPVPAQGAVVQGWPAPGGTANAPAAESGRR